ncbi:MAG: hypothetical protein NC452_02295 [Eubacterium sp.]|nr:hypothetical protein [Eubacterium sp.]
MSIQQILFGSGGVLFVVMTLVQLAPLKINPWTSIAKAIGRAVNSEVLKELDAVKKKLEEHVTMDDRRVADGHRTQILRFNNELLRDIKHTKEEYIEALTEIDAYEKYCTENPNYPNNRAVLAIENIRGNYRERLKKHDFLAEE